jgi:hypothetical protein
MITRVLKGSGHGYLKILPSIEMNSETFDFKSELLFPFHFHLLGIVFFITGILSFIYMLYLAPILILVSLFIITAYRGVDFNRIEKKYREYNSFFFLKFGNWEKYEQVEKIFVNTSANSQKIFTMVTGGITVKSQEFNAYLKFDSGTSIFLIRKKDKKKLLGRIGKLSDYFQLEIQDLAN